MGIKWSEKLSKKIMKFQKSRHLFFKGRRKRWGKIGKRQKIQLSKIYWKERKLFLFLEKYFWFLMLEQRLISGAGFILSYCNGSNRSDLQIYSWFWGICMIWAHEDILVCKSFTFMATECKGRFSPKFKNFLCLFVFKHKLHGIVIESWEQKFRLNKLGMIFVMWKKHSLNG